MPFSARTAAVILGVCVVTTAVPRTQAQSARITPVPGAAKMQQSLSMGRLLPHGAALSPCEADQPITGRVVRPFRDVWAGRFRATDFGIGTWKIVVASDDGSPPQERQLPAAGSAGEFVWETGPFFGSSVTITLHGPGNASARCPLVWLDQELKEDQKSTPRGLVGPDNRWSETSAQFASAPDSAALTRWGSSIAHVQIFVAVGALVPCTGFFVSSNLMLTAGHCIPTDADAARTTLLIGGQRIRPDALRLLVAQDIDFSLVWVDTPQKEFLTIADAGREASVLWQQPSRTAKLISVDGCVVQGNQGMTLVHKCDSVPGASGAPLQTRDTGEVVALHIAGCVSDNEKPSCVNHALRMSEIRRRILSLEKVLRTEDPVAAAEVFKVFRPSQ